MSYINFKIHQFYVFSLIICCLPIGLIIFENYELQFAVLLLLASVAVLVSIISVPFINNYDLIIVFISVFIGIYMMTILPFATTYYQIIFILPVIYYVLTLSRININSIIHSSILKKKDIGFFIAFLIPFLISVMIYNLKDLKDPSGIFKLINYLFGGIYLSVYIPQKCLAIEVNYKKFLRLFPYIGLFTAIIGIISIFVRFTPAQKPGFAPSFFVSQNTAAFLLSFCIPVTLYLILFKRKYSSDFENKKLFIFSLILMFINLLFTFSRAGYISVIFSVFVILYFKSRRIFLITLIIFLAISGLLFSFLTTEKGASTLLSRVGLIYAAIEMLKSSFERFLWGYGMVSVFDAFQDFKDSLGIPFDTVKYPHNFILFYIMQSGFISFIPLVIYFIHYFIRSIRHLISFGAQRDEIVLPFAITFSLLIQSLFEDTLLMPQYYIFTLFTIFFGMLRYFLNKKPKNQFRINSVPL